VKGGKKKSFGMLALFLMTGAVLGGILGELIAGSSALADIAPYLIKTFPIFDFPPVTINLYVVRLVLGFALHPNLISILGVIAAIFIFRRF
jgi:hypothetical protein